MKKLLALLREIHPSVDFESCLTLIDDKILDSFDIITLIGEIGERFHVEIPPEEIVPENFNSARQMYQMIRRLSAEQKRGNR